ncbi:hypothetical protein, partial [Oenococcus oeni]
IVQTHQSIKSVIKNASFKQWQVARQIGINETTLIVWLRNENDLNLERRNKILAAIKELSNGKRK